MCLPTVFKQQNDTTGIIISTKDRKTKDVLLTPGIGDSSVPASLGAHPHHQIVPEALQQQAVGNWSVQKKKKTENKKVVKI